MNINTKQIVSISEANQNFSRVARMADKHGSLYIFKNNKPKYKLVDIEQDTAIDMTDDEKIDFVAARILKLYCPAFANFDGTELYPTKEEKGARLGYSLISNRAFVDGNKRIGMYVLLTFLETNGTKIRPTNEEVARVGIAVASGEMKYNELLEWIIDNE